MPRVVASGSAASTPAANLPTVVATTATIAVSRPPLPSLETPPAMVRHVTDARHTSLCQHEQQQCDNARHAKQTRQHTRSIDHSASLHIAAPPATQSTTMASTPTAHSYTKYIRAAKQHHPGAQMSDQHHRASTCSTASTMSSSTRASDVSSVSSASSRDTRSLNRHTTRRRQQTHSDVAADRTSSSQPSTQQQQVALIHEHDPDYLPIDSTQYKLEATQKKKRRARRIKLKHYSLAKQAAKLNNLSGFVLHAITPRESSVLTYTSLASPGTHIEYDIVVENVRTGMLWQVARRYSAFRLLRDELLKPFQAPHCHYCSSVMRDMHKLETHFPGKRLWGSTSPAVVKARAERFQRYLHGLLDVATSSYKLNCRLIAGYFVVQLRNFLTTDSKRFNGIPGAYGEQIPCLLRALATPRSSSLHDPMPSTLQTIQEHSSRSSRGSLWDDTDAAAISIDSKDLRAKLRVADDCDRQCLQNAAAAAGFDTSSNAVRGSDTTRSSDSVSPAHGFGAYLREDDEFDDDSDSSDSDSDGDSDSDVDTQQQHE